MQQNNSISELRSYNSPPIQYSVFYQNPSAPSTSPIYSTEMASLHPPVQSIPFSSQPDPIHLQPGQAVGFLQPVEAPRNLVQPGQTMGYTQQVDVPMNLIQPGQPIAIQTAMPVQLTDEPQMVRCGYCNNVVVTDVRYKSGLGNWVGCMILTAWGCVNGLCLVPFCINKLKDAYHYCSNCGQFLGSKARIEFR
jgi:hypothetical protein